MKYLNILSRLYNTPLAMDPIKLATIHELIGSKLLADTNITTTAEPTTIPKSVINSPIPIVRVVGSLVSKNGVGDSGITSYESITREITTIAKTNPSKIGFFVDSPGGETTGLFTLTSLIKELTTKNGIETFAFVDGTAASASYAIASATQKIYATEDSFLGSIGVISMLAEPDSPENLLILKSRAKKSLLTDKGKISPDLIAKVKKMTMDLDAIFSKEVTHNRPQVTMEIIDSMEGDFFITKEASKFNLFDQIVSNFNQVLEAENMTIETKDTKTIANAQVPEVVPAATAEVVFTQTQMEDTVAKALVTERTRVAAILKVGAELSMPMTSITPRIIKGASLEAATEEFTELASFADKSTPTITEAESYNDTTQLDLTPAASIEVGGMKIPLSDLKTAAKATVKSA